MATWMFEPGHTEAEFRARHMMVTWVRGLFKDIHGQIELEAAEGFEVVGLGSVIVTRLLRGRGLLSRLVEPLLALAADLGPERAMLFCRPELVALYRGLEFVEIGAPVWVDQPGGRIEMPLASMWRPLRAGAEWPPGRVDVRGLPF